MSIRRLVFTFILALTLSLSACSGKSDSKVSKKTEDFNFTFAYGVGARNIIDTQKGTYTKDMVCDPSITIKLKLTDDEMNIILKKMKEIDIFSYPDKLGDENNHCVTPFITYRFIITYNDKHKEITWHDESLSNTKEAESLRSLAKLIVDTISKKDEYKKLPVPKGGYD